jgi:hypothetical protein
VPFALFIYLIYRAIKKQLNREVLRPILASLAIIAISVVSMIVIAPSILKQFTTVFQTLFQSKPSPPIIVGNPSAPIVVFALQPVDWKPYIVSFITIPMLAIFAVLVFVLWNKWRGISNQAKIYILALVCLSIILLVSACFRITTDVTRMQEDLAVIFAVLTLALLCCAIKLNKIGVWTGIIIVSMAFGLISGLNLWRQDNSAIKEPDKEAIAYMNTLNYTTYDCLPTIRSFIYNFYTKEQYVSGSDLFVTRNIGLTNADIDTTQLGNDYKLMKSFADNGIIVSVYEK